MSIRTHIANTRAQKRQGLANIRAQKRQHLAAWHHRVRRALHLG
jgi:hypothetical protein